MGACFSSSGSGYAPNSNAAAKGFAKIADTFESLEQVQDALRKAGLESSNIIIAVDYTKSNDWNGKKTFNGRSLHDLTSGVPNPYQRAINIISRTLEPFDDDKLIPCYGFGDGQCGGKSVFSFKDNDAPCNGLSEVESLYERITPSVHLSGPTSFAPAIRQAMKIVADRGNEYHILLLLADGQVSRCGDGQSIQEKETIEAIVEASKHYALSIVMVGVGDGPWEQMEEFDDQLPQRRFDNFQFVNFSEVAGRYWDERRMEAQFALSALMEIPDQFKAIMRLGILGKDIPSHGWCRPPLPPPRNIQPPSASGAGKAGAYSSSQDRTSHASDGPRPSSSHAPTDVKISFMAAGVEMQTTNVVLSANPPNVGTAGMSSGKDASCNKASFSKAATYGGSKGASCSGATSASASSASGSATSAAGATDAPPKSFVCPITTDLMKDPVMGADGHSYERSAIEQWLNNNDRSPMTNEVLPHKRLTPNHTLRCSIQEYAAHNNLKL